MRSDNLPRRLTFAKPTLSVELPRAAEPLNWDGVHERLKKRGGLHTASHVVSAFFAVLVAAIGGIALVVAVATHFSPEGEYTVFGHPTLVVVSGSMAPAVQTGDLLVDDPVQGAAASQLHAGQIITFRSPVNHDLVETHRIVAVTITPDGSVLYQTKGDANNAPDDLGVSPSEVIGVYRMRVLAGGYVLNALNQPLVLALLVAAPLLWLLSGWLFQLARDDDLASP